MDRLLVYIILLLAFVIFIIEKTQHDCGNVHWLDVVVTAALVKETTLAEECLEVG